MSIKHRMILISVLLSAIPAAVVGLFAHFKMADTAQTQLVELANDKAMALSENKSQELELYLSGIESHIKTMSANQMVVSAMENFSNSFDTGFAPQYMRDHVVEFYQSEFIKKYKTLNGGDPVKIQTLTDNMSDVAWQWQYHYLSNNPNALGEKDELIMAPDNSLYSQFHSQYHEQFKQLVDAFGYYDIFLVDDSTGHVVYSVFKETDFATSLNSGPYRDSGLAKAFQGAKKLAQPGVYFENFQPYLPSYEGMAAFISAPIFMGSEKIGVLIFQMPILKVNALMTYGQQWEKNGMGENGESYLVMDNGQALSELREYLQSDTQYLDLRQKAGTDSKTLEAISAKGSMIGLHKLKQDSITQALAGNSGVLKEADYRGEEAYIGYRPVDFLGTRWVVLTSLSHKELFKDYDATMQALDISITIATLVVATLGGLIGLLYATSLVKPIQSAAENMLDIAQGDGDLTKRLPAEGKDETAALSRAFNSFAEKVQHTVSDLIDNTAKLDDSMAQLKQTSAHVFELVDQQNDQSDMISTAVTEMAASVQEVANNAESVATASAKSSKDADVARGIFENTLNEIGDNCSKIQVASSVINQLEDETKSIGSVLDVIRGIAEQTNLLALNAAIEAARAGEQGRGFAVVADEVRTLASRTQASTQEIEEMISKLQTGAENAVNVMAESQKSAQSSIDKGHQASDAITSTASAATQISEMMIQVATATEEQSTVAEDINMNIVSISGLTRDVASEFSKINNSINNLVSLSGALKASASQFKV